MTSTATEPRPMTTTDAGAVAVCLAFLLLAFGVLLGINGQPLPGTQATPAPVGAVELVEVHRLPLDLAAIPGNVDRITDTPERTGAGTTIPTADELAGLSVGGDAGLITGPATWDGAPIACTPGA